MWAAFPSPLEQLDFSSVDQYGAQVGNWKMGRSENIGPFVFLSQDGGPHGGCLSHHRRVPRSEFLLGPQAPANRIFILFLCSGSVFQVPSLIYHITPWGSSELSSILQWSSIAPWV